MVVFKELTPRIPSKPFGQMTCAAALTKLAGSEMDVNVLA